jgi:hypothetical protein
VPVSPPKFAVPYRLPLASRATSLRGVISRQIHNAVAEIEVKEIGIAPTAVIWHQLENRAEP